MIVEIREALAATLFDEPFDVYATKPDDIVDLPCVVVDRPTIEINVQHHVVTCSVVVVGRRDGSDDAQTELDTTTDRTASAIAGPEFAVNRIEPATAVIADLTYPAYRITVSCGVTICAKETR